MIPVAYKQNISSYELFDYKFRPLEPPIGLVAYMLRESDRARHDLECLSGYKN